MRPAFVCSLFAALVTLAGCIEIQRYSYDPQRCDAPALPDAGPDALELDAGADAPAPPVDAPADVLELPDAAPDVEAPPVDAGQWWLEPCDPTCWTGEACIGIPVSDGGPCGWPS